VLARLSLLLLAILAAGCGFSLNINPKSLTVHKIALPLEDRQSFSFGDISYDQGISRVIVPAGEAGLFLIDPENPGKPARFSVPGDAGGAGGGFIAATRRLGARKPYLFVANLNGPTIEVLDLETGQFVSSTILAGPPESIVFISTTEEIWVAEPAMNQIEIFKFVDGSPPRLDAGTPITELKQPVGLTLDNSNALVYFNQVQTGFTTKYHALRQQHLFSWANGCTEARDIALDNVNGYLYIACSEGKLVVTNPSSGIEVISKPFGGDLYQIDFNQANGTIYLPSGRSAILGFFSLAEATPTPIPTPEDPGIIAALLLRSATPTPPARENLLESHVHTSLVALNLVASADTSRNANCVTSDDRGNIWVCDPEGRGLLLVKDPGLTDRK
jgi:hypothetical protein